MKGLPGRACSVREASHFLSLERRHRFEELFGSLAVFVGDDVLSAGHSIRSEHFLAQLTEMDARATVSTIATRPARAAIQDFQRRSEHVPTGFGIVRLSDVLRSTPSKCTRRAS